jgi:hypothetical protein
MALLPSCHGRAGTSYTYDVSASNASCIDSSDTGVSQGMSPDVLQADK